MQYLTEHTGMLFVIATFLPLASFTLLLLLGALRWALRPYAKNNAGVNSVFEMLGGAVPGPGPAYVALAAIALSFLCCAAGFACFLIDEHEIAALKKKPGVVASAHHGHDHDDHGHHDHGHPKDKAKQPAKNETQEPPTIEDAKGKEVKLQPVKPKKEVKEEKKKVEDKAEKEAREKQLVEDRTRLHFLEHRWEGSILFARLFPLSARDTERGTRFQLGYRIDMLSAVMFVMVTFIATLIHLFSIGYMKDELQKTVEDHEVHLAHGHLERRGRFGRFFMYLSLFCFSMLNLLLADNLFQIFVSWELVGVCSFLLIGFYFERQSATNAANKAFITNRVGDAGFVIGLLIIWAYFGTFNFQEIFSILRAPSTPDAHTNQPVRVNGKPAVHQLVLASVEQTANESGGHKFKLDKQGNAAILFPREPNLKHYHTPESERYVYDQPRARQYGYIPYWLLVTAGLGIFLGCVGKSAQFPLQVWLPDAMEGPTPVSALIHAATMVAAGVYLVGRSFPLFTPEVLLTISYVGAITLFVAATIAVVMTDIKKVLAYSTVSQLGYMMLGLGVGGWTAGLLHLLTHAFFKALLFLGSGSVIYGCHHQQDMLKMGGLYNKMKITGFTMLMGVLAISGIPLFSGWYSKDEILAGALGFASRHPEHALLFLLPLVTAGITTFYMFRMWFMTFTGKPRDHHVYEHAHESPWMMTVPLILLAILSVGVAWGVPPTDPTKSWLGLQLHHSQPASVHVDFRAEEIAAHENHTTAGVLALAMVVIGLTFASVLYFYNALDPAEAKEQFPRVHAFLAHKWYFDELYSAMIVRPGLVIGGWCKNFDLKIIDGFVHFMAWLALLTSRWSGKTDRGVVDGIANLIADVFYGAGSWLRNLQTGYIRSYVLFLALAAMGIWMALLAWARALGGQ